MKTGFPLLRTFAWLAALGGSVLPAAAQWPQPDEVWVYTLTHGSQLVDDCPVCDRAAVLEPLRGSFELRLVEQGPLFATYALDHIDLAGTNGGWHYRVTGQGSYRLGGEVAVVQSLTLEVIISGGFGSNVCYFTNASTTVSRRWPMLQVSLDQTNGTPIQQYHLDLCAAPFREIWFSTARPFAAGIWNAPSNSISEGDLLSTAGHVVKLNSQLMGRLGIQPPTPNLGLRDVDILPGGEVAFSTTNGAFSETLGPFRAGDLLSDQGRILRTNFDLIAAFEPTPLPPVPDFGLHALQFQSNGEIWFSLDTGFKSKKLGLQVQPGDLLSDAGVLIRSNAQLLAPFKPVAPTNNVGLNAVYVWPGGEIWFATATGFTNASGQMFGPGDLLSDQGYVVYTNGELTSALAPTGGPADFGLDAFYVVTDVTPPAPAPTLRADRSSPAPPPTESVGLTWGGSGRVFQILAATNLAGPYLPSSPIMADTQWIDPGAISNHLQRFYRLQQW